MQTSNFPMLKPELEKESKSGRVKVGKLNYQAKGVLYIPEKASYDYLLDLPEGSNIGSQLIMR